MNEPPRPDPDALLRTLALGNGTTDGADKGPGEGRRGRLKVFLGAAPGVGKTCEMLDDAVALRQSGIDVVIGLVETHGRMDTVARTAGFEMIPRKMIVHHGRHLEELDIDAVLARRPALVLVDELAHTNAPGSRHDKRYQDVEEILDAGIDVHSTLNIQHLESLNDVVASFTRVRVRETLPDRVLEQAEIEIVDLPPDELIERLRDGKVYVPEEASRALAHFFSKSNLSALRELALRRAAQAIDAQMLDHVRAHALAGKWAAGERLVVAVSEHPGAIQLVRAAKRMADALGAPWSAVHVETARDLAYSDAEARQLAGTLELAQHLGGQTAAIPAETVYDGLVTFLDEARATQLILGKAPRSRWHEWRHGSVVDYMVRNSSNVAIQVLALEEEPPLARQASAQRIGPNRWGSPTGYAVSLVLVALVTMVGHSIAGLGNITNIALLYLLPVLVAATRFGLRTGLVTGLASSLAYNFFFIPPLYTFTISDPQNLITVMVLLGIAVLVSQMASRVRDHALLARLSAAQNSALAGFARQVTGIADETELGQVLCAEVARLLDVRAVFMLPEEAALVVRAANPPDDRLETLDRAAARWAYDNDRRAGRGSDTLTACEWMFSPISAGGRVLGVLGVAREDTGAPVRTDQMPLLSSLLDQAGLALERIALETEMTSVAKLREQDRLRTALLSSVSHDLRTPLTAIIGNLAAIAPADATQAEQLGSARAEADRLRRFVANLLDMARIEAGALTGTHEPVDLADAITGAVHDLRGQLVRHPIRMEVSPDLPFVVVDPQLFHQCLINLIDNAAKYGNPDSPITIAARREPGALALMVMDEGPGLPPGSEDRIFETFARIEGSDRKGGTGLGLAIVRGFCMAMGLRISAANRADHPGACFTIRFDEAHLITGDPQ
ncbi:osmosensitive K channel signal transduction histidine kinase [Novosphingobium nitrogenifigens DSM 19370]|uniref:histidine kinase n=1 Tax=Novosphingobium nitrogenifigens DSM 19370 TaxID=983920 RepID=F1ZAP8_9SPHN|nr:sensor histidine kinase KdpD [Novosphingobium nitrogenifigens]EGD58315.1 osmosensitive K channel signal transduction histidine kinase [Novosphingobium nitrogenifigens DSM 19370]